MGSTAAETMVTTDATEDSWTLLSSTSKPTEASIPKLAILMKPETGNAVSSKPMLELLSQDSWMSNPVMKMLSFPPSLPSDPFPSPSTLLVPLSSSIPQESMLNRDAAAILWIMVFWLLVTVPKRQRLLAGQELVGNVLGTGRIHQDGP